MVLRITGMNTRFFLAAVLCLLLIPSGAGQELVHFPTEESVWGNPYPGLGNVSPSAINPYSSLSPAMPPSVTLYANDYGTENYSELLPTTRSTELYLSRFPSKKRTGIFQKVNFNTLWTPRNGSKGLGMTELDLSAVFAVPMPTPDSPLVLTPKFSTTFFDSKQWGSETFYTTGLGMLWIHPIAKDKLTLHLGASVLYSGDFRVRASEAMRFPVYAAGIWNLNPRTKVVLGVVYADRRDSYNWFPMAGLIWTPNDEISVELLVPRMRIAQRVHWFDSAGEDWLYTAFEFGSGSWGSEYADGRFEYRDLRFLLGYERRTRFGLTFGLEVGYMFDRNVESEMYGNDRTEDCVFLRLRTSY